MAFTMVSEPITPSWFLPLLISPTAYIRAMFDFLEKLNFLLEDCFFIYFLKGILFIFSFSFKLNLLFTIESSSSSYNVASIKFWFKLPDELWAKTESAIWFRLLLVIFLLSPISWFILFHKVVRMLFSWKRFSSLILLYMKGSTALLKSLPLPRIICTSSPYFSMAPLKNISSVLKPL